MLRRRSGLEGGIGGFFQRPFVEIEAREGAGRVDFYDGADAAPKADAFAALAASFDTPEYPPQGNVSAFANALAAAGIEISDTRPGEEKATASPVAARPLSQSHLLSAYTAAQAEPAAPAEPAEPLTPTQPAPTQISPPVVQPPSPAAAPAQPAPARSRTHLGVVKELIATGMDERFALG